MMHIFKKVAIIGLLGVITIVTLNAKDDGCRLERRGEMIQHLNLKENRHNMRSIFKKLNLSDEQKDMIRTNRKEMRELINSKKEELSLQKDTNNFITVDGVDKEAMIKKAEEHARIIATIKADFMEKTLSILTYKQKEAFVKRLNSKL